VLLAEEEMVFQGMIDRLFNIGRCYGMDMNVEKLSNENLKATVPSTDYGR